LTIFCLQKAGETNCLTLKWLEEKTKFVLVISSGVWYNSIIVGEETMLKYPDSKITGTKIAKEIKKKFGSEAETVTVKMKYRKQVGDFVREIEKAHEKTEKSKLIFTLI